MALEFEFDGHDLIIEDPTSSASWLAGMEPFISSFASEHYGLRYELIDDLSDEKVKALSSAVGIALVEYRKETREALASDKPFTEWQHVLGDALACALDGDNHIHEEHDEPLYGETFTELYEALDAAMEAHDGPVADVDTVIDEIRSASREKMEEHDWTTIYDAVGKYKLPLQFVPGYTPGKQALGDFDISADEIQECTTPGYGEQALLNLLRVSIPDFMAYKKFDYTDTDLIDAWVERMIDPTTVPSFRQRGPVFRDLKDLDAFFSDAGGTTTLPCWIGSITPNSLKLIDPLKDNELTGGLIGLTEWVNGSGSIKFLGDQQVVVLTGDWVLEDERGHTVEEVFGLVKSSLDADIKPVVDKAPERTVEPREFAM